MIVSNTKYKIIDLFAGAGGLSNGFEQTGRFEVVGAVEINKAAQKTYIRNHKNNPDIIIKDSDSESDITKINFDKVLLERDLSGEDLVVVGGPPCQGFSNANRQKNYLVSGNNQLVKEYVKAVKEIKPIAFVMENVKTIISDTHKFFVTEHGDQAKFKYSSKEHLQKIVKSEDDKFWHPDKIYLLETRHLELNSVIEFLLPNIYNTYPLLPNENWISRLRSIERRLRNSESIRLKDKDIKEVEQIIVHFNSIIKDRDKDSEWVFNSGIDRILHDALFLLETFKTEEMKSSEVKEKLGPLIDLNTFLFHIKEVREEKIIIKGDIEIEIGSKLTVKINVESYNVIEYLERVFKYLGYRIDKGVITASDFGVPQRRNRFIMFGVKKEFAFLEEVKLPEKNTNLSKIFTTRDAIEDLENIKPQEELNSYDMNCYINTKCLSGLLKYYRTDVEENVLFNHINTKSRELSKKRFAAIKESEGKNFHSLTEDLKNTYADASRTQNTVYLRLDYDEPAPTVINVRKSMWNHPVNAVALSIREAARLQSFKDNFIFEGTKDQQYQQVGNAVPPLMARAIAERLLEILGDKPESTITEELNLDEKVLI
ncbi:DNA cytosine methyltransferase [Mesobacillus maritimus]|uniref:DNA cytosine methyltransferase n=1 Tax=Mesobacillus maritimus TaxID=1643336 RepID=UPI002041C004|nr:DNA cytosine methyltransferase [Mesobacillus maritimus]MCM3671070.1 DNA cytosine methyltransferase [Mesobacillus maritimus]